MNRIVVVAAVVGWVGLTLVLDEIRAVRRPTLLDRLRPYAPGGRTTERAATGVSLDSFRDVIGPLAQAWGARVTRLLGVSEDLSTKLWRIHSPLSVQAFRLRQLGWTTATFGAAALVALGTGLTPLVALMVIVGAPLLIFLVLEQQIHQASSRWQERILLELPVVSEQLGMLLGAGYSLGGALNRLATRGSGACAADLERVCGRMRQGLSDVEALREWAGTAGVAALDRLVHLLALNREAGDLGRLISDEAQAIRADVHRRLVATIDKRGEQVWIPVTVATLLPGVIFLAVPFIEALRLFSAG